MAGGKKMNEIKAQIQETQPNRITKKTHVINT